MLFQHLTEDRDRRVRNPSRPRTAAGKRWRPAAQPAAVALRFTLEDVSSFLRYIYERFEPAEFLQKQSKYLVNSDKMFKTKQMYTVPFNNQFGLFHVRLGACTMYITRTNVGFTIVLLKSFIICCKLRKFVWVIIGLFFCTCEVWTGNKGCLNGMMINYPLKKNGFITDYLSSSWFGTTYGWINYCPNLVHYILERVHIYFYNFTFMALVSLNLDVYANLSWRGPEVHFKNKDRSIIKKNDILYIGKQFAT